MNFPAIFALFLRRQPYRKCHRKCSPRIEIDSDTKAVTLFWTIAFAFHETCMILWGWVIAIPISHEVIILICKNNRLIWNPIKGDTEKTLISILCNDYREYTQLTFFANFIIRIKITISITPIIGHRVICSWAIFTGIIQHIVIPTVHTWIMKKIWYKNYLALNFYYKIRSNISLYRSISFKITLFT